MQQQKPLPATSIFCVAASSDASLLAQWETHLTPLMQTRYITVWSDRHLMAGTDRLQQINSHMEEAQVIVFLLSPDFFVSDECMALIEQALQGSTRIIPLLLRPADWKTSKLADLACLPTTGQFVTTWDNLDRAFQTCVDDLRQLLGLPAIPSQSRKLGHALTLENQNRLRMLRRLRRSYSDLMSQSLQGAAWLELGITSKPDAVQNAANLLLRVERHKEQLLPSGTSITQVYDEVEHELLILGEPGAGKSTLLLDLAQQLVMRAEDDQTHLLPVILPLSSWAVKHSPLQDWIAEQMSEIYDVPRQLSERWVREDRILPLLDGLDEMEETAHAACIAAINTYHREHLIPLVVCSRTTEYETASERQRLALQGAVVIQSLTHEDVDAYLVRAGNPLTTLRSALKKNTALHNLATTPLMLNILILTYQGTAMRDLSSNESLLLKQVWNDYVQRMVERKGDNKRYPLEQTRTWLSYLAQQMRNHNQTVFYLEHMQPTWLRATWQRQLYHGLVAGPICGLFVELAFPYLDGPWLWFTMLMTALIMGLLFGWVSKLETEEKKTSTRIRERIRHSLATVLESRVKIGIMGGFVTGVGVALYTYLLNYPDRIAVTLSNGLIYGLFTGLFLGLAIKLEKRIEPVEALSWSWTSVRRNIRWLLIAIGTGLLVGMISALPLMISRPELWLGYLLSFGVSTALQFTFVVLLVIGVIRGLSKQTLDAQHIVTPNQGTWRSARYGVVIAIITGVISAITLGGSDFLALRTGTHEGFIASVMNQLPGFHSSTGQGFWTWASVAVLFEVLTTAATLALTAGLYYGGTVYVQHFVLRFLLWCGRSVPFNYPHFLDYAASRILLRKVGGGYIFIHRLLLEHFASLEEKKILV